MKKIPFRNLTKAEQAKARVTTKKLFPSRRHPRAPLAVQDRAGLWLDLFMEFAGALTSTREGMSPTVTVELAEELADRCLDAFEKRWPTAEVPRP